MDNQVKQCADCKIEKELGAFAPTTQQLKFGVKSRCRECEREYKRQWIKRNPERKAKYDEGTKEFQRNNRQKIRDWNRRYAKRIAKEQPERMANWQRRSSLKRKYGVTPEWFDEQAAKQNGLCAICRQIPGQKGLCVDHCHKSSNVRELLCSQCNTSLHKMEVDIEWFRRAEAYLLRFGG